MRTHDFAVMPFFAGVSGAVMVLGTVIGQSGNANSFDDSNPMSGMDMGPGSSMSSMPGMSGEGSSAAPAAGSMTMPDGSTMASSAMPMNMSDPKMAASMPGGLHTSCSGATCTVIFASTATGTAAVLGTTAKLDSASAKQLVLTVGKKKLTLRQGRSVSAGHIKVELTKVAGKSYTVTFTKTR